MDRNARSDSPAVMPGKNGEPGANSAAHGCNACTGHVVLDRRHQHERHSKLPIGRFFRRASLRYARPPLNHRVDCRFPCCTQSPDVAGSASDSTRNRKAYDRSQSSLYTARAGLCAASATNASTAGSRKRKFAPRIEELPLGNGSLGAAYGLMLERSRRRAHEQTCKFYVAEVISERGGATKMIAPRKPPAPVAGGPLRRPVLRARSRRSIERQTGC